MNNEWRINGWMEWRLREFLNKYIPSLLSFTREMSNMLVLKLYIEYGKTHLVIIVILWVVYANEVIITAYIPAVCLQSV